MTWGTPTVLAALAALPVLLVLAWRVLPRAHSTSFSSLRFLMHRGWRGRLADPMAWTLRLAALFLLIAAIARPQWGTTWIDERQMAVDVMLALDLSGSMRAEDFQPENRLVAAKQVIGEFIGKSTDHRMGLVVFAGRSLTVAPLTLDHAMVREALARVDFQTIRQDGTAIGDAIGNCLYRLKEANSRGRVIVLFTDGENNSGYLDPIRAAGMARVKGIRIHTIAVGKPGGAPIPMPNAFGEKIYLRDSEGRLILPQINEVSLKRIAAITGGRYFRATDTRALRAVYDEINRLERSEVQRQRRRRLEDHFQGLVWLALALVLLRFWTSTGRMRVLEVGA
ncbi:MAG: VWA domain-containing protein [Candidatus Sericytochromatia bacterium]|nr:VWA domain-containing protein [Candidatus Sericytochromatia bacterium]